MANIELTEEKPLKLLKNSNGFKYYDVLECNGNNMNVNKKTFLEYQREANMGKSIHVKILDKQVLSKFSRYVKKPFTEVTKENIINFFHDLESGNIKTKWGKPFSQYTIEQYKSQIKKFYKWLYKWEQGQTEPEQIRWIQIDTKKAYKHKTQADILTTEELNKLIKTAKTLRNQTIICVLYDSATRVEEFSDMKIGDLVFEGDEISVCVDGKTGQRELPLNSSIKYLKKYLNNHLHRNDRNKPLWLNRSGKKLSKNRIQQLIYEIAEKS